MPRTRTSGQGRPKGSKNKHQSCVRQMVEGALEELGGQKWLVEQAKIDPKTFTPLLNKLMPTRVEGDVSVTHTLASALARAVAEGGDD